MNEYRTDANGTSHLVMQQSGMLVLTSSATTMPIARVCSSRATVKRLPVEEGMCLDGVEGSWEEVGKRYMSRPVGVSTTIRYLLGLRCCARLVMTP